ncbi:MAG: mechanosensitive ion channel [Polyangiaceae bacterium]|nr:mechanosensitive ion channel [Myxococcales bacterium]MCB9587957.1 mechanosensitive ion channel [Polyangiaceae bacterium]
MLTRTQLIWTCLVIAMLGASAGAAVAQEKAQPDPIPTVSAPPAVVVAAPPTAAESNSVTPPQVEVEAAPVAELMDDTGTRLQAVFRRIDRFAGVQADATDGVVRLRGEVKSTEDAKAAEQLAKSFSGVIYVDNGLTTPIAVSDRLEPVGERAERWMAGVIARLPLMMIALLALIGAWALGRYVSQSPRLLNRVVRKPLLRDIARRVTRMTFTLIGVLIALEILDATAVLGTLVGAAGVLSLVVGFAFRDIAENYLASLLLIGRRPFDVGDAIEIDGQIGKVMRLTMRETVLMTFDGNHLSLPNSMVFKAKVLNFTRNPRRRFEFVVGAGVDADLLEAQQLGVQTLLEAPGVIPDPKPFAQIEELGDSNVAIRFFGWVDQRVTDFAKARGEAIRRVKTALDDAGVDMPEPTYRLKVQERPAAKPSARVEASEVDVAPDDTIDREIAVHQAAETNLIEGPRARPTAAQQASLN